MNRSHRSSDLPTIHILRNRQDFLDLNTKGKKWVSRGLILQAKPHAAPETTPPIRVGYTVTKRVDTSAVKRNRIKRRLRAAVADILAVHALPHHDYVLIGRAETATRPYDKLQQDLQWCLKKMGLWQDA